MLHLKCGAIFRGLRVNNWFRGTLSVDCFEIGSGMKASATSHLLHACVSGDFAKCRSAGLQSLLVVPPGA